MGMPRGLKKLISELNATSRSFLGLPMNPPLKHKLGYKPLFLPALVLKPIFPGDREHNDANAKKAK
jgi:hypothetical protein